MARTKQTARQSTGCRPPSWRSVSSPKFWGLYPKSRSSAIPLKHLNISVEIVHNIARVFYTQTYQNDGKKLLETEFFFPIAPDACFDSFEAEFDGQKIKGVVKSRSDAKKDYKKALESGETTAYSEIQEDTGDIMKIMIGNIPPKTTVKITYSYVQKLDIALKKFWCFRLFSAMTPRYNSDVQALLDSEIAFLSSYPIIESDSEAYPWNVEVNIQSPSAIHFVKSPSHDLVATFGNEDHTCDLKFDPITNNLPNRDFVLFYHNGDENKPDYLLTPFEDGYCAMVTLFADFNKKSGTEIYQNFENAKEVAGPSYHMDLVRGEYIFLLDRSGSMSGETMEMSRLSLVLALKSLPQNCYFNVVSFGSKYKLLYSESVMYSEDSVRESIEKIEKMEADMGGTEIHKPLTDLFSLPLKDGYPRILFLLTDGEVSNTLAVLSLIQENRMKAQVFTLGIGNGCSAELIKKAAYYGRGQHEFIESPDGIHEKVFNLLNASLSPCLTKLKLQGENFDALVSSVNPNPAAVPFLLEGQSVTFFVLFRQAAFQGDDGKYCLRLELQDADKSSKKMIQITLDVNKAIHNSWIPKLGVFEMIKSLEEQKGDLSEENKDILWMMERDIKETLIDLSIKNGILCKETAFICEISKATDRSTRSLKQKKITIPILKSHDYQSSEARYDLFGAESEWMNGGYKPFIKFARYKQLASVAARKQLCTKPPKEITKLQKKLKRKSSKTGSDTDEEESDNDDDDDTDEEESDDDDDVGTTKTVNLASLLGRRKALDPEENKHEPVVHKKNKDEEKSCVEVMLEQAFGGYWNWNDSSLCKQVLNGKDLPIIPDGLGLMSENVWMTVLVLCWLEIFCTSQQKVWHLIHRKGQDWLKNQGVNYNDVAEFGFDSIKELFQLS